MNERRLIRWILFSVPIVCALQWAAIRRSGEPYPALMFPGFGGFANANPQVDTPTVRIVTPRGEQSHPAFDLFPDLPLSMKAQFVGGGLSLDKPLDPVAVEWMWQRVLALEPNATAARIVWTRTYPEDTERSEWLGDLTIK